jgi:hypothetical protein
VFCTVTYENWTMRQTGIFKVPVFKWSWNQMLGLFYSYKMVQTGLEIELPLKTGHIFWFLNDWPFCFTIWLPFQKLNGC